MTFEGGGLQLPKIGSCKGNCRGMATLKSVGSRYLPSKVSAPPPPPPPHTHYHHLCTRASQHPQVKFIVNVWIF